MNRRKFLSGLGIGGASLGLGGATLWFSIEAESGPLTIDHTIKKLDLLMKAKPITHGPWNLSQILSHCAESVEYSMTGYPEHKSDLFKSVLGNTAFSIFSAKGKMTHKLDEEIPGAPLFDKSIDVIDSYERFRQSLIDFDAYQSKLKPHFAYGNLSKKEYELAHAMHFNNHLDEITTGKT